MQAGRVVSCYEAGRDGFWLHRFLHAHGIENRVVDSASIEVNRRARRQKSDRLDAEKLLSMLLRESLGDFLCSLFRIARLLLRVNIRRAEDSRQKKYEASHRIASEKFSPKRNEKM